MKSRASKDFGASLRAWRVRRGWDQATLAEQLGVTRQTVSYWERGETGPFPAQLQRIQDLMGVDAPPLDTPEPEAVQAVMVEAERALVAWWRTYAVRLLRAAAGEGTPPATGKELLDNSGEIEAQAMLERIQQAANLQAGGATPSPRIRRRQSGGR